MQLCLQCKLLPVEFLTHKRKILPSRELCADCVKIKRLIQDVDHCDALNAKRQAREKRKKEFRQFQQELINHPEIQQEFLINKEKLRKHYRVIGAKNRAARKKSLIEITEEEKLQIKDFYNNCPKGFHVDHIIPISKGGKHILSNLQYLTKEENFKKNDKVSMSLLSKFLEKGIISVSLIMSKFKMNMTEAKAIYDEITRRSNLE